MAQGRLGSVLSTLTKQKLIPAIVIDVLDKRCSVRLSGTGGKVTGILYVGMRPDIGDTVLVDYRGMTNPIALTTTNYFPTDIPDKKKKAKVRVQPAIPVPPTLVWTSVDNGGIAICRSDELHKFVAISGGNVMSYSEDGFIWTEIDLGEPETLTWLSSRNYTDICWSPELGLFVCIMRGGIGGYSQELMNPETAWWTWIATSTNGIDWTETRGPNGKWESICWSPELGLFVAVGSFGSSSPWNWHSSIMVSSDGFSWVNIYTGGDGWQLALTSVCWSAELGMFAAMDSNHIVTSPDGYNWTYYDRTTTTALRSIIWSKDLALFIAIGSSILLKSSDGITWDERSVGIDGFDLAWSPELSKLICVGSHSGPTNNNVSKNGIIFETGTIPTDFSLYDICYSPELQMFVAMGLCPDPENPPGYHYGISYVGRMETFHGN